MAFRHTGLFRASCAALILIAATVFAAGAFAAEEAKAEANEKAKEDWQPETPMPDKFDWIQLTSDEWLKGEFIAMYERELEFDSDELDLLTFDWEDVKQVRSAQVMQVGFVDHTSATGKLIIEGDKVRVLGEQDREFDRSQILSITAGEPREINFWSGNVNLGATTRQGNLDQVESNLRSNFKRRTIKNRLIFDYIANFSSNDDVEVANNHRASFTWDRFITNRFFLKPVSLEYYRDPFQNIAARYTFGVGAGFQLIDTPRTDWEVSGGPAIQETTFEDVMLGEEESETTPALSVGTVYDIALTKSVDFVYEYRFQITNEATGKYNHHMVATFETELTGHLDFDVSFVWDRTELPQIDSEGNTPAQDDFRTVVAVGFDF